MVRIEVYSIRGQLVVFCVRDTFAKTTDIVSLNIFLNIYL